MEALCKEFQKIGFVASYMVGILDYHLLMKFDYEEDYLCVWCCGFWTIFGFGMQIIKWTLDFCLDSETPLALIWISLDQLPRHLFHKVVFFAIGRLVGEPLKIDISTTNGTRPSKAMVCIELDLLKPRIHLGRIVNSDKASGNLSKIGGGEIARDPSGNVAFGFVKFFGSGTNLQTKANALLHGTRFCYSHLIHWETIEMDSKALLDIVNQKSSIPWQLDEVI
ncbi:hypothetical protein ACH5RR_023601 [Cinchona calisaya]|uniref:RNase H type-1 domain-containing protein n=1 Tax=Cinchona calisaya TaxID=153742 RepID=A0ABD2ZCM3_9GENT